MLNVFTQNMAKLFTYTILTTLLVGVSACGSSKPSEGDSQKIDLKSRNNTQMKVVKGMESQLVENKKMTLTGQILYQSFEGGFYGFVANDGKKYMPSGLKSEYRKNGLIVEMQVEPVSDRATTQQFGTLVKILEIKVIDASKVSDIQQTM